jgi:hypothetical protein
LALLRVQVFWDVTLCCWVNDPLCFKLSYKGTKLTYCCRRRQHDFSKPWAPLIHQHNITSQKTAALMNLTTSTQILCMLIFWLTFQHFSTVTILVIVINVVLVGNLCEQQLFCLTNNIPHVVCRYVCGQLFVRSCMRSSSDLLIITLERNAKENF